jgi:hypothetical protein
MTNFLLAVCFTPEGHDKAQFSWNFCPSLQDVSKTALLVKALLVSLICSWYRKNRMEHNSGRFGTVVTNLNILNFFRSPYVHALSIPHFEKSSVSC